MMPALVTGMVTRLVNRVRVASAASVLVRSLLIGSLGLGVTVGGVLAGALIVSPVVTQVSTKSAPMAAFSKRALSTANTLRTAVRERMLTDLPAPVRQFAAPALLMVSVLSGLTALFMRRQTPLRSLQAEVAAPRSTSRLTPRSTPRIGGKHHRTPKAVEALAASGASASDIAWKTGLPFDAVQLLLAISTGPRQLQPPTA